MTPAARIQAGIDILDTWLSAETGLDRVLQDWGRANRYAGSGDRRAVADLVYGAMRRKLSCAWRVGRDEHALNGRWWMLGALALDGVEIEPLFSGKRHAPPALGSDERAALAQSPEAPPRNVRLDLPEWLLDELADVPDDALSLLRERAPLDLRVNRLKSDPATALASLASDGIVVEQGPFPENCLRVTAGAHRVRLSAAYCDGLVEIQDASSQAVAEFAGARPDDLVLDLCAGGGGKSLAMAATMGGRGRLCAYDIDPARLAPLRERALRAGAAVETLDCTTLSTLTGRCDLVLVDAPCSGSGAWRRNPDAKWRLTPGRLAELGRTQRSLLQEAFGFAAPGGRVVYGTCSMLTCENDGILSDLPVGWGVRQTLVLHPEVGGDGFFAAELARTG